MKFLVLYIVFMYEILLYYIYQVNSFYINKHKYSKLYKYRDDIFFNNLITDKLYFKTNKIKIYKKYKLQLSNFDNSDNNTENSFKYINNSLKDDLKDIQGVWKFYLPIFVMDTDFAESEDLQSDKNYKFNKDDEINEKDFIEENNTNKSNTMYDKYEFHLENDTNEEKEDNDKNINLLRGERLHPLPLFVYNNEHIISGSDSTYAYWSNEYKYKNIYESTIKIINKFNSKFMLVLQGYLFISHLNSLKDENIRLKPSQIFGNLFLAVNDLIPEKSLIPSNLKIFDKNGNEIKDVMSILEKKIPYIKKGKQKIQKTLGLKNWKFLGLSTAYKILGEEKNIFNINHILTKKDLNVFYNILHFDTINNYYKKKKFLYLKDIFNSYFEQPSDEILNLLLKNVMKRYFKHTKKHNKK